MLANLTQFKSGNRNAEQNRSNKLGLHFLNQFHLWPSAYSFAQQLFIDGVDVECLMNAVAFK